MSSRIKLEDSLVEAVTKMSEGNPGAVTVITRMLNEGDKIDPQSFTGGFGAVLLLDTFGIYGSRIWMLYKDVASENITNTIALLRACQLGLLSREKLDKAISNHGKGIEVPIVLDAVKDELDQFDRQVA